VESALVREVRGRQHEAAARESCARHGFFL
jgi:hypothetical protein